MKLIYDFQVPSYFDHAATYVWLLDTTKCWDTTPCAPHKFAALRQKCVRQLRNGYGTHPPVVRVLRCVHDDFGEMITLLSAGNIHEKWPH
jgi:hypothetical protein